MNTTQESELRKFKLLVDINKTISQIIIKGNCNSTYWLKVLPRDHVDRSQILLTGINCKQCGDFVMTDTVIHERCYCNCDN